MTDVTKNPPSAAKRRRNRKKKSKSKNSDAQKEEQRLQEIEDAKMNSHVKLRNDLLAEGFSAAQIDKAMEEMWNGNLMYDEYDEVLKYLKTGGKIESFGGVEESKEVEDQTQNEGTIAPDVDKGNSTTKDSSTGVKPVTKDLPSPAVPSTMAAKLDMVAGFEHLSDAIFAMTEWIIKVAKPQELVELCEAVKTSALPTVIERSISECDDQSKFDTAILPAMVRLLESLLKRCGLSADDTTANYDSFKSILRQSRRISLMRQAASNSIAARVSMFIVSRIFVILNESKATRSANTVNLKSENASLASFKQVDTDKGIDELLSKREMNKLVTKRFCVAAQSACHSLSGMNGGSINTSNGVSEHMGTDKEDILSTLVDEDTKRAFDQHVFMYTELKTQVKEGESDVVKRLRQKVEDLHTERQNLGSQIAELRKSIEKLEAMAAELFAKQENIQNEIDAECESESKEASRLNSELQEATNQLKGDEYIRSLVDMMKQFDDSLASKSLRAISDDDGDEANASKLMDMYLSRARDYFMYESSCYQLLQSRIQASQKEVSALKLEIEMCEGLGMTTTINQMEESKQSNEGLIETHAMLVERIKADANSMFQELMNRLEEYKAAQDSGKKSLLPIRANSIQGLPQYIAKLEVRNGDNLDAFLAINDIISIQPPPPPNDSHVADAEQEQTVICKTVTTAPKLTWANGASGAHTTQKTSLLDIQKQELESKR